MQDDRSLLDLVGLEQELEELLQRKVDVLTDASIHQLFVSGLLPKREPCEASVDSQIPQLIDTSNPAIN
jgi:hypothetical protein